MFSELEIGLKRSIKKNMPNKAKVITANILIIFGFLCLVSGVVMLFVARDVIFGIVSMFVTGVIALVVGGVFWKKSDHPMVEEPKVEKLVKQPKPKKYKPKKVKKPFMTEEEWRQQEEEDDEMMFIEEVVKDD